MVLKLSIATALASIALGATALGATGDLNPQGCIDDTDTGADTCFQTARGLDGSQSVAVSPDGASVYVAASDADAIVRFDRDPATGDLTPMGCVEDNDTGASGCAQSADGLDRAAAVAVSPDGSTVYVAGTDDDAIVRLRRNTDTGRLTPKDCVDDDQVGQGVDDCAQSTSGLNGATAVAVSADGESVYTTGGNDSTIVRFRRGAASGTLTPKGCIDDVGGNDCGIETTDGLGGAFSVAVSPDGESVYVASLTDDAVVRFDRNTNNGKLTPRGCVNDVAGEAGCPDEAPGLDFARSVAVSPDGASVYVASSIDDAVARFDRDPADGALTPRNCVEDDDFGPGECAKSTEGLDAVNSVAVSPDGASVYATSLPELVNLKRNTTTGALIPDGCIEANAVGACAQISDGLNGARSVAMSADGASLYAAAEFDDAIVQFVRDPAP